MVEEEGAPVPEVSPEEKPKSKKKMILVIGAFALLFILSSAANFIHLRMTYVPPEPEIATGPVEHEEEGPILKIDLGEEESYDLPEEILADVASDSFEIALEESISPEDSIQALMVEMQTSIQTSDSLLAATTQELEQTKKLLKTQQAEEDSSNIKKSVKLAKIVGNMPPKEAARMLEPLEDLMVLDVLMRLKQRQAAKIMAKFSAQRSARLSEVILKPLVQGN